MSRPGSCSAETWRLFFRALRQALGGEPLPYVWVPEWHKTDHGLHVHFAVGRFIPRGQIQSGVGSRVRAHQALSDLPVGSTTWHEARKAAGYLSKYVAKSFDGEERERALGLHRYEVGAGFPAAGDPARGPVGRRRCLAKAETVMGGPPAQSWSSDEAEDWKAPPAVWFAWD